MIKKVIIFYLISFVLLFCSNKTLSFEDIGEKIKNIDTGKLATEATKKATDWAVGWAQNLGDLIPNASFKQRTLVSSAAVFFAILGAYSVNRGIQEIKETPLEAWQEIKRAVTRAVKKATMGLLLTGLGMGAIVSAGFIIKAGLVGK